MNKFIIVIIFSLTHSVLFCMKQRKQELSPKQQTLYERLSEYRKLYNQVEKERKKNNKDYKNKKVTWWFHAECESMYACEEKRLRIQYENQTQLNLSTSFDIKTTDLKKFVKNNTQE